MLQCTQNGGQPYGKMKNADEFFRIVNQSAKIAGPDAAISKSCLRDLESNYLEYRKGNKSLEKLREDLTVGEGDDLKRADSIIELLGKSQSLESFKNQMRDHNLGTYKAFNDFLGGMKKGYNVGDTSDIRIIDISRFFEETWSVNTPFLNMLGDSVPVTPTNDLRFQWWEVDDYTALDTAYMDPDKGPDVSHTSRTSKSNTIAFVGGGMVEGRIASDIQRNQGYRDEMELNLAAKRDFLRRVMSYGMLNNTEEYTTPPYKNNGVLQQLTTNTYDFTSDGGLFDDLKIDQKFIKPVWSKYGLQNWVIVVGSFKAIDTIDGFRLTRAAVRPMNDFAFGTYMSAAEEALRVPIATIYQSRTGLKIPVVLILELPDGYGMMLDINSIKPAYMKLPSFGGGRGPYVMMSMLDNGWAEVIQIFDTFSVKVDNEKKNWKFSNLTGD